MEGSMPFDPRRLLDVLLRKWHYLLLPALGLAVLGFWGAYHLTQYSATVKLKRCCPASSLAMLFEDYLGHTQDKPAQTMIALLKSPGVQRSAAAKAQVPATPEALASRLDTSELPGTEMITVTLQGNDADQTVRLLNTLAEEAVRSFHKLGSQNAEEINRLLEDKLSSVDEQLGRVNQELVQIRSLPGLIPLGQEFPALWKQGTDLDKKSEDIKRELDTVELQLRILNQELIHQSPAINAAREALTQALQQYTEEHPKVSKLRASLATLEAQAKQQNSLGAEETASGGTPLANSLLLRITELRSRKIDLEQQLKQVNASKDLWIQELQQLPERSMDLARITSQSESLNRLRSHLVSKQQEILVLADQASGSFRIQERANTLDLSRLPKIKMGVNWGLRLGLIGFVVAALAVMIMEAADGRIRTHADLRRVSEMPVLAELGDLTRMTEVEQDQWAFRTFMILKGHLHMENSQTIVCGFTSSSHGEGRSTCVKLLAKAADRQGYQVLALSGSHPNRGLLWRSNNPTAKHEDMLNKESPKTPIEHRDASQSVTEQPAMPMPLPDRAWSLECRQQWREVLTRWSHQPNLAVFVELPPACEAEGVLMSDNQWPLVWICGKDMARAQETRSQLETLRNTRCRLVGSVFNRAAVSAWKSKLCRWSGAVVLFGALLVNQGFAQESKPDQVVASDLSQTNTTGLASAKPPNAAPELADWQKHLTLGPGDVITISIYDQADSTRSGLFIGPDGRINYLQARDFEAAGLTIDELRAKLEEELSKYYLAPRVIVQPEAYRSKKYIILGNVSQKGVFPLDRPVSILEAVARSKGFETAYQQRNALVLADLSRSFLVRKGEADTFKQVPVDFEALFLRGDFSQNVPLAPGDYLYFPPLDVPEVYVLGEVRSPGVAQYAPDVTVLRAIIARGGFTDKAYRKKILVVRGSFSHPQTFVVDASGVLTAKNPDVLLQPRDVVYVSRKPWAYPQELLEMAVTEYMRAMVITWTGQNIGPITKDAFVPNIK